MSEVRITPLEMNKEEFREIGYRLIDMISTFLSTIRDNPVTHGEAPRDLQKLLGNSSLPETGKPASEILATAADLMMNHSLFNGHPRFLGYITSSAAPIGALADLLASAINSNVGAQILSPVATEIEKQTVRWLAEFIGVDSDYGGVLVSGGNMANITAFLAAVTEKAPENFKEAGLSGLPKKLLVYCPKTTHTWIEKAAMLSGLGSGSIRWIKVDGRNKMDTRLLEKTIQDDLKQGFQPIMVIGTAGDVST